MPRDVYWWDAARFMLDDPVKDCNLYKDEGCAHVDGPLCDPDTCQERIDYDNSKKN